MPLPGPGPGPGPDPNWAFSAAEDTVRLIAMIPKSVVFMSGDAFEDFVEMRGLFHFLRHPSCQ